MLQQTTVAAVRSYFLKFITLAHRAGLAEASLDDVLRAWAGLGYYARARNLHACAKTVQDMAGEFPDTEAGLRALPGIGPYTAALSPRLPSIFPPPLLMETSNASFHGFTLSKPRSPQRNPKSESAPLNLCRGRGAVTLPRP